MHNFTVQDVREHFRSELANGNYTEDKTGQKTIELLGASFIADEPAIFGTPNKDYILKELKWYDSMSTNINDINEGSEPPAAWKYAANKHGEINSNYGYLIYSNKYNNQFHRAVSELLNNPNSRRAEMIYTRPDIWLEYNEHGKSDFICTNTVTYYIRDNLLHSVVQMRSNDVIYGYKNDYAWQLEVARRVVDTYNRTAVLRKEQPIEVGDTYWQVQNLHVYEKHFHLVK